MNLDLSCVFEGLGSHGALYISNSKTATNFYLLEKLKIRAVLTAAKGEKIDISKSKIQKYLYLEIQDYEDFDLEKYFDQAYTFIENARKLSNVLIHCHFGASRSLAIVMAYLIRKYSYSLPQIYSIIKRKRYFIQPNPGFIKQLEEYSQLYSVRNTQFTMPPPKPKCKVQRSVSLSTPIKDKSFELESNDRQIKSEQLKQKIEKMRESHDLFKQSKEKIQQLYQQREEIEKRLKNLRQGLIKGGDLMRKKEGFAIEARINKDIKFEEEYQTTNENINPNRIENIQLYNLATKPQMNNRLTYKKQKSIKNSLATRQEQKKSRNKQVSIFSPQQQETPRLIKIPPLLPK